MKILRRECDLQIILSKTYKKPYDKLSTNGNRHEYSSEELQNLQLYPNCVSTLPDKIKPHKTAHFEVSRHNILLLNSKNESMS